MLKFLMLADWKRSEPRPCGEDLAAEAAAEAARLEAKFSDDDLARMIRSKGLDAGSDAAGTGRDDSTGGHS